MGLRAKSRFLFTRLFSRSEICAEEEGGDPTFCAEKETVGRTFVFPSVLDDVTRAASTTDWFAHLESPLFPWLGGKGDGSMIPGKCIGCSFSGGIEDESCFPSRVLR